MCRARVHAHREPNSREKLARGHRGSEPGGRHLRSASAPSASYRSERSVAPTDEGRPKDTGSGQSLRYMEVRTETSPQRKATEAHDDNLPISFRNRENHTNRLCLRILAREIAPGEVFEAGPMLRRGYHLKPSDAARDPASGASGSGAEASPIHLGPLPTTQR